MAEELFSGALVKVYVQREGTYGTPRKISGAQGSVMLTVSESLTPKEEREVRPDRSGSSDHLSRFVGRVSAEWEITKLILPNGSATTEPDDNFLWENALGRLSMGATSFSYVQATAHNTALTIRRGVRVGGSAGAAEWQDHVWGAIANRVEIGWGNQGQNGLAKVTFGGMAKQWGYTGNTTLSGAIATSTKATCTVTNAKQLSVGSLVKFGIKTTGASGVLLTTVNYTTNQIGFANLGFTASKSDAVTPYNPTATTSGTPIHARIGFLSLDGSASQIKHLGGRVTMEGNRDLLNEEVGSNSATRVFRKDRRNVTFSLEFLVKKDEVPKLFGDMVRNTAQNIQINLGDTANKQLKIRMKNCEFDLVSPQLSGQDMMKISMTGRALGVAGNDSLNVKIN